MSGRRDPEGTIFLVGFMGVGKSTVGSALADLRVDAAAGGPHDVAHAVEERWRALCR